MVWSGHWPVCVLRCITSSQLTSSSLRRWLERAGAYLLSVAEHVCNIIRSSAQTRHALRLLRAHGMANASLYTGNHHRQADRCCECVVGSWPSTLRGDHPRSGKRTDLCSEDHPALDDLVERADDELFDKILINSGHVLYSILPRGTVFTYTFRRIRHNRELTSKTTHLAQCSFIVRMLYKDMY